MREHSANTFSMSDLFSGLSPEAKSLFRNILAVTPCDSGFCVGSGISRVRKLLEMNILGERIKKNYERYTSAKSQSDRTAATLRSAESRRRLSPHFYRYVCR
jgi:hypothetical protein